MVKGLPIVFLLMVELFAFQSIDPVAEMKKLVEADGRKNPVLVYEYGKMLAGKRRFEEALVELTWCLDHGTKASPRFEGVLGSVYKQIEKVSRRYEPARNLMTQRAETATRKLMNGEADAEAAQTVVLINHAQRKPARSVDLFDELEKQHAGKPVVAVFANAAYSDLLDAARFGQLEKLVPIDTRLAEIDARYQRNLEMLADTRNRRAVAEDAPNQIRLGQYGEIYRLLRAQGHDRKASDLAQKMLGADSGAETHYRLASNGLASGKVDETVLGYAEKAHELSDGKELEYLLTLARVLEALDRGEEALALIESGKKTFTKRRAQHRLHFLKEQLTAKK